VQSATARTVEAVWRMESARLIGALARTTGDLGRAEDLAQDALLAALEQWPGSGVPDNPAAWLMTVAKRRAVDGVRRQVTLEQKLALLGRELPTEVDPVPDIEIGPQVSDDVLRLMFTACHPVLAPEARVALTLRLVAGLSTEEIARAFVVPTPTMAARITRAKKALTASGAGFEVPAGDELIARLPTVLEAVYLVFNEGYTATSGSSWSRPALCAEAMRLGRMLAALVPSAEALGLVALMEIQASRLAARTDAGGRPVTLLEQDRARWDRLLITHALNCLDRATALDDRGPYVLQAAIAAGHARAATAADTDWPRIAQLYGTLVEVTGSPVVELNRAVAVAMADGPLAGLAVVDELVDEPALRTYHLVPSVRGDLLVRLGRLPEARREFERAAAMTANQAERAFLLDRAAACG
jgi:RNA polymerase sigma factor (sigma-70 family)